MIETRPGAYRLALPAGAVDAHDFEARVREARRAASPAGRSGGLGAALALWHGPALADAGGLRFSGAPAARDLSLPDVTATESATRTALGEEAFTTAYDRGRTKTFPDLRTDFALH
ncbi:BTAD domain-containing putative transcriptional regulator [Actinomadura chokoriensis]|uniref:BTAD domain-containing putative transcriptional regulator n=1 Tax=Actinomadura chokoriensis TaxID=454156 RepID=A0ABV4QR62_9ACTN